MRLTATSTGPLIGLGTVSTFGSLVAVGVTSGDGEAEIVGLGVEVLGLGVKDLATELGEGAGMVLSRSRHPALEIVEKQVLTSDD